MLDKAASPASLATIDMMDSNFVPVDFCLNHLSERPRKITEHFVAGFLRLTPPNIGVSITSNNEDYKKKDTYIADRKIRISGK
jgi:hypothetical protein